MYHIGTWCVRVPTKVLHTQCQLYSHTMMVLSHLEFDTRRTMWTIPGQGVMRVKTPVSWMGFITSTSFRSGTFPARSD